MDDACVSFPLARSRSPLRKPPRDLLPPYHRPSPGRISSPIPSPAPIPSVPLRAVFLDVGNTLLSEVPSRYAVYAAAAVRRGREVSPERMHALMAEAHLSLPHWVDGHFRYTDRWFEAFIARIFGEERGLGFGAQDVSAITLELFDHFESAGTFVPFPGAEGLLAELRAAELVVGVISNWSSRLSRVLEVTGLAGSFDLVLTSALEGVEKPDAALFRRALERAGVGPTEALHAGDDPVLDVQGARAAGLGAVLVDHAGRLGDAEKERVTSLAALAAYILERTR